MTSRIIYYLNGKMTPLDGRIKSFEITGETATAYRSCSVSLNNTTDGRNRSLTFKNGGEIRVFVNNVEQFRGVVFDLALNTSGEQSLKAHDYNVYLTKNSDTVNIPDKTATQIVSMICGKFGIKTGALANTRHVIPKFIMRGKTAYDIIVTALTITQKATGKRYRLRNRAGLLELVEVSAQVKRLSLENKRNIMSASYTESIEDVKTRVKLTGGDENKPVTVEVSASNASTYGIMQHYEHNGDVKTAAKLKPLAQQLLAELNKPKQEYTIEALGDTDIISGTSVIVSESLTGMTGVFYVAQDTHKHEANGFHTMSLRLSRELELPTQEYDAPEEPKPKKPKKKKKSKKLTKKEKVAKAKAKKAEAAKK
ncbi:XkdQ/YqbQ family protein [Sporosarcina psychrophila]|uniref:YqbQ/XkdQ domain-containing protein n=1 Tax=Sporosarcina psychrophila TaxID=1476 RepID=A0ABV2KCB9_SPOPS